MPVSATREADSVVANGEHIWHADGETLGVSALLRGAEGHNGIVLRDDECCAIIAQVRRLARRQQMQRDVVHITLGTAGMETTSTEDSEDFEDSEDYVRQSLRPTARSTILPR